MGPLFFWPNYSGFGSAQVWTYRISSPKHFVEGQIEKRHRQLEKDKRSIIQILVAKRKRR
jgi:hypothetical protein